MYTGKFDLDQDALKTRIAINSNDFNLEDWIFDKIQPVGSNILDLGCGSGKQTKYILEHFPGCYVTAVDKAKTFQDLPSRVMQVQCDFDNLPFNDPSFDLVLSVYSFYYSRDMGQLLAKLKTITNPGGTIFLVGPGRNNNIELMREIEKFFPGRFDIDRDFFETEGEHFRAYNTIQFPDTEGVWKWWQNHNTFAQDIYETIKDRVHIQSLTKSILGIKINV